MTLYLSPIHRLPDTALAQARASARAAALAPPPAVVDNAVVRAAQEVETALEVVAVAQDVSADAQARLLEKMGIVEVELQRSGQLLAGRSPSNALTLNPSSVVGETFATLESQLQAARTELIQNPAADPVLSSESAANLRQSIQNTRARVLELQENYQRTALSASPEQRVILETAAQKLNSPLGILNRIEGRLDAPGVGAVEYGYSQTRQASRLVLSQTRVAEPLVLDYLTSTLAQTPTSLSAAAQVVGDGLDALRSSLSPGATLSQGEIDFLAIEIASSIRDVELVRGNYDQLSSRSALGGATGAQLQESLGQMDTALVLLEEARTFVADPTPNNLLEAQNRIRQAQAAYAQALTPPVIQAAQNVPVDTTPTSTTTDLTQTQARSPTLAAGAGALDDAASGRPSGRQVRATTGELRALDSPTAALEDPALVAEARRQLLQGLSGQLDAFAAQRQAVEGGPGIARASAKVNEAIVVASDPKVPPADVSRATKEAVDAVDDIIIEDDPLPPQPTPESDGRRIHPAGVVKYPRGHREFGAGEQATRYPNGVVEVDMPDGRKEVRLLTGEVIDGEISSWYNDNTMDLTDGTRLNPEGRIDVEGTGVRRPAAVPEPITNPNDGSVTYPDGRTSYPEGHPAVSSGRVGVKYPNGVLVETGVGTDGAFITETLLPDGRTVDAGVVGYDPATGRVELTDGTVIGGDGTVVVSGPGIRESVVPIDAPPAPTNPEFERVSERIRSQMQRDVARVEGEHARVSARITELGNSITALETQVTAAQNNVIRRIGNNRVVGDNAADYARNLGELELAQARLAAARAELSELTSVAPSIAEQATAARERVQRYGELVQIERDLISNAADRAAAVAANDLPTVQLSDLRAEQLTAEYETARTRFNTANETYMDPASRVSRLLGRDGPTSPEQRAAQIQERYADPAQAPAPVVEARPRPTLRQRLAALNPLRLFRRSTTTTFMANPLSTTVIDAARVRNERLQQALLASQQNAARIQTLDAQVAVLDAQLANTSLFPAERLQIVVERATLANETALLRNANPGLQAEVSRLARQAPASQNLLTAQEVFNTRINELTALENRRAALPRERQTLLDSRRAIDEQLRTATDPIQRNRLTQASALVDEMVTANTQEGAQLESRVTQAQERVRTANEEVTRARTALTEAERPPTPAEVAAERERASRRVAEIETTRTEVARTTAEADRIRSTPEPRTPAATSRLARLEEGLARARERIAVLEAERGAGERIIAEDGARPPVDGTPPAGGKPPAEPPKTGTGTADTASDAVSAAKGAVASLETELQKAKNNVAAEKRVVADKSQKALLSTPEGARELAEAKNKLVDAETRVSDIEGQIKDAKKTLAKAEIDAKAKAKTNPKEGGFSFKALAKGFVCDTAGAIAGYKIYAGLLKDEIENKVTIEPGSENVLDPNTGEIIFQDGQNYKLTVTPDPSVKGGKKLTIDVVSPQEKIPANAWVDDCGQAPIALEQGFTPTPARSTAGNQDPNAFNQIIQESIQQGKAAGEQAAVATAP